MNRLNPTELKRRLQQLGIQTKKGLGQHFLIDQAVLEKIVTAAELSNQDTVLEIGPGPGVLTEALLERAGRVVSFELDPQMVTILQTDFPQLELYTGDVLKEAPAVVRTLTAYKVVANIPYQITTPLLKLFLEGELTPAPLSLTLLMQREVAERLAAPPRTPGRGYLSVLAQYFAEVEIVSTVPQTAFWPAPEVESAIIQLNLKTERPLAQKEERAFLRYVKSLFLTPRKQLKNVIAGVRGEEVERVKMLLQKQGLPETVRAQELTEADWLDLFKNGI